MTIYLLGYSGRTVEDIQRVVGNGLLLDIRLSPQSRRPGFSRKSLEEHFGESYMWLYEFGNENYTTGNGDIALYDPEVGLEIVRGLCALDNVQNIFLMCVCKNEATCHRRQVGELLRAAGYQVEEWGKT